jgi:hypothetical protein
LLLQDLQLLLELLELGFQLSPAIAKVAGLLLGRFATLGLLLQLPGQPAGLLFEAGARCLQFLNPVLELNIFAIGTFPLRLQLLLRCFHLVLQLLESRFDFTAAFSNFAELLLGFVSALRLLGQRAGQSVKFLRDFCLGCLQFLRVRLKFGLLGA